MPQNPQLRHMFGVNPAKAKKMEDSTESPAKRKADARLAAAKRHHKPKKKHKGNPFAAFQKK